MAFEEANKYLEERGVKPKISFTDKQKHRVKLLGCEKRTITDQQGKEVPGMVWNVIEDSQEKSFFTSSIGLVNQLSQYDEGDVVDIQMKSRKDEQGNFKSYYQVSGVAENSTPKDQEQDINTKDIPF